MRFSLCYRVVRLKGFFWGRRLFFYRRRFAGFLAPLGSGRQLRLWTWALGDGFWGYRGCGRLLQGRRYGRGRVRNAGYVLFRLLSPQLEPFWAHAWSILRFLLIRHRKGQRYRLGLPAQGQRTHSNAATTRRVRSAVSLYLRARYWFERLWEPRKSRVAAPRSKSTQKRATKGDRRKTGVVRSKKSRKDVWK